MIFFLNRALMSPLHGHRAFLIACFLSSHLIGTAVELLQSIPLHLQFHLRILLEDLRLSLAKHLCDPLVRYPSGTEAVGIGRAQIVNAKVWYLGAPQGRVPGSFRSPLVSARAFIARKQNGLQGESRI
jgi:hypothetical protein